MVQLPDRFVVVAGGDLAGIRVRVVCMTKGGAMIAYASMADNAINDAYFIRGFKLMTLNEDPPVE